MLSLCFNLCQKSLLFVFSSAPKAGGGGGATTINFMLSQFMGQENESLICSSRPDDKAKIATHGKPLTWFDSETNRSMTLTSFTAGSTKAC